ncbi:hypothetical protein V2J09_006233 [Rumex salicifolius]
MVLNYKHNHPCNSIIFIMLSLQVTMPYADLKSQDALLRFKKSLSNATALKSWDPITPPCYGRNNNWVGISCSKGGNVYGLRLEIMGLSGKLNVGTLSPIRKLRSISFMNNKLDGLIPNVNELKALKSIYLSNNMFEGTIDPEFFRGMKRLRKLHLSNNKFTGHIPISLTKLPKLIELRLDGNEFQGSIPNMTLSSINDLSLANNKLSGLIPTSLFRMSPQTFVGNKGLCGMPLKSCQGSRISNTDENELDIAPNKEANVAIDAHRNAKGGNSGQLYSVKEGGYRFDLDEIQKEVFHEHMERIGRLRHKNVVPLVAYYFRNEEKLLVSNIAPGGSLAFHLHVIIIYSHTTYNEYQTIYSGSHKHGQPTLDWPTRLNIIKGVARGLAYIHEELSLLIAPHGHLKSSNVLLDEYLNPLIHDYGLIPLIDPEYAQQLMMAYKSPEYIIKGRINKKTDVWCFGILIIEIMTGRFISSYLQKESQMDLSCWIKENIGDGYGHDRIFDKNIGGSMSNFEGNMHKLLNIGIACCESDVEKRCDIKDICERIKGVKEKL